MSTCQRVIPTVAATPLGRFVAAYNRPCARPVLFENVSVDAPEQAEFVVDLCSQHAAEEWNLIAPEVPEPEFIRLDGEVC